MNEIEKTENHELVAGGGEGLCGFFVPGAIDKAFRENEFTIVEMIEVLTDIVRDTAVKTIQKKDGTLIEEPVTSARERMAALHMLDKKAKEGMVLGGLIQKDRLTIRKKLEDGSEAEYNAEGMRLTQEGSSRLKSTLALLEGASKSKSDKIIDMEVPDEHEGRNGSGNASRIGTGAECGVLTRRPRGSDSDSKPARRDGGDEPRSDGSGGDDVLGPVHGQERTGTAKPRRQGEDNDQESTGGAEDEREGRVPEQPGRGTEGEGAGGEGGEHRVGDRPNPVPPAQCGSSTGSTVVTNRAEPVVSGPERRPIIPGERAAKRDNWWKPGIPRRSEDSDGSIRDCVTAESSLDRLKRIDAARKQAAAAAASYTERRKKNQCASDLKPGDEPRTSD